MWLKIIADSFSILQQTLTDSSPSVVIDTAALMINAHRSFFFPIWSLSKRIFFFFGWKERTRLASVIQGRFLSRSPSLVTESFRLIHVAFYFFWCRPVIRFPPEEEKVKDIHNWLILRSTWSILKEHIDQSVMCLYSCGAAGAVLVDDERRLLIRDRKKRRSWRQKLLNKKEPKERKNGVRPGWIMVRIV